MTRFGIFTVSWARRIEMQLTTAIRNIHNSLCEVAEKCSYPLLPTGRGIVRNGYQPAGVYPKRNVSYLPRCGISAVPSARNRGAQLATAVRNIHCFRGVISGKRSFHHGAVIGKCSYRPYTNREDYHMKRIPIWRSLS